MALALVSLALIGATAFTYRNARTFAEERMVRAALAYSAAFDGAARRMGPRPDRRMGRVGRPDTQVDSTGSPENGPIGRPGLIARMEELLSDTMGEDVLGAALLDSEVRVLAQRGVIAEHVIHSEWLHSAARSGELTTEAGADAEFFVVVPLRAGGESGRMGRRRFDRGRAVEPPRPAAEPLAHYRRSGLFLLLSLDPTEAERAIDHARLQAVFVAAVLILAWSLGWMWRRLARRSAALERQAARRERFAELGEMAAVMAHEIRNPLGAIRGHAQLLERKLVGDERAVGSARTLVEETSRLGALVDSLLRYARPRPPSPRATDLVQLVRSSVALVEEDARSAGVSLVVEAPDHLPPAVCDEDQMGQVLLNLIINAIQAAQARASSGEVRVTVAQAAKAIEVLVEDSGVGVPPAERERIFAPFVTTRSEGSGLGLSISRQIVEAHGGTLEVAAEPSDLGGATFVLRLSRSEQLGASG